jgi:hypothetical protein
MLEAFGLKSGVVGGKSRASGRSEGGEGCWRLRAEEEEEEEEVKVSGQKEIVKQRFKEYRVFEP